MKLFTGNPALGSVNPVRKKHYWDLTVNHFAPAENMQPAQSCVVERNDCSI